MFSLFIMKNASELKKKLTKEEYNILREEGTEQAFTGKFVNHKEKGMYVCKACENELFSSNTKFDSRTGWPSFDDVASSNAVELKKDNSHGMHRIEVKCKKCKSHLGHLFDDGITKTRKRYCINSICLDFKKK